MAILNFIKEAGVVGWLILATGGAVIMLTVDRIKHLYFKYDFNSEAFSEKIHNLIISKKNEEALIYSSQLFEKPLAKAFKIILEKSDRDEDTLFHSHDIALSEIAPLYTKKLHYLSMLANVATLLGLLGTIHGLILSFQAVAQADPATKQALLANGIAVSMYTTALGLAVAIPAMVIYSFLTSKQNELLEQLQEKTSKLTEWIINARDIHNETAKETQEYKKIEFVNESSTLNKKII